MSEEVLTDQKAGNFKWYLVSLLGIYFVYVLIISIMGLRGSIEFTGMKLFNFLFYPFLFLAIFGGGGYVLVVKTKQKYKDSDKDGNVYSFEECLEKMKGYSRSISGMEPSLEVINGRYGEGFYGDEPATRISHALFVNKVLGKNKYLLVAMQNGPPHAKSFRLWDVKDLLTEDYSSLKKELLDDLTMKPYSLETVKVSEYNPLTGTQRSVKQSRPVFKSKDNKLVNAEFTDKPRKPVIEEKPKEIEVGQ